MFELHHQLKADTIKFGEFDLSEVLLMNNAHLPWLILVPRRNNIKEWHALEPDEQVQLHHESMLVSELLMHEFKGDKLNIGALGNLVPQLHLHHIVRHQDDPVWPQPVWGNLMPNPYVKTQLDSRIKLLQDRLNAQTSLNFTAT